ncbi:hypothetical protein [Hymenobacter sp. B81]|uniref:hypothetical protein n=1 Tax=Hymenobacter sp. B81 TaxID=3344878 RepID=UPI0037DD203C
MPNFRRKKLWFLVFPLTLCWQALLAQSPTLLLQRADSLTAAGQLENAYLLHRQVLRSGQASPRLLLQLAALQESRGRYAAALYYLNLYQVHYPSRAVWVKMTELAQTYRLTGYPDTWQQQLRITLRRYYPLLLQGLLSVAVAAGMLLALRHHRVQRGWWVAYAGYIIVVLAIMEVLAPPKVGLVCRPHAALMTAPSAAANWLTTAAAGDRLLVRGQHDIWFQVVWRGQMAYIRQHDLLLVQ